MIALLGDAEIAYEDAGGGLPVVFLHAFPLNRRMWDPQKSALVGHARCIVPDLRGFGESSVTPPFSMDRHADDVVSLLDTLHVDRAVIVGASWGGYISFALWRRHRGRVRALVLADSRAGADSPETIERRQALMDVAHRQGSDAVAALQIGVLIGETTRARHRDVYDSVHASIAHAPVEGIVGALEAMIARPDSTPTLATIDVPTLIVVGSEDTATPPSEAKAMHHAIRGSRLQVIEQSGHLPNLERPAAFNAVLSEFLESIRYS